MPNTHLTYVPNRELFMCKVKTRDWATDRRSEGLGPRSIDLSAYKAPPTTVFHTTVLPYTRISSCEVLFCRGKIML
ncbi:hypothetical protein QQG55_37780 [Brugia pahangi]